MINPVQNHFLFSPQALKHVSHKQPKILKQIPVWNWIVIRWRKLHLSLVFFSLEEVSTNWRQKATACRMLQAGGNDVIASWDVSQHSTILTWYEGSNIGLAWRTSGNTLHHIRYFVSFSQVLLVALKGNMELSISAGAEDVCEAEMGMWLPQCRSEDIWEQNHKLLPPPCISDEYQSMQNGSKEKVRGICS